MLTDAVTGGAEAMANEARCRSAARVVVEVSQCIVRERVAGAMSRATASLETSIFSVEGMHEGKRIRENIKPMGSTFPGISFPEYYR